MSENSTVKTIISDKSFPVPIEMRPLWRICLIVIALIVVAGDKRYLDIKKVNILVWMLIRRSRWDGYEEFLVGRTADIPLVSVDTSTYKAVEFAIAKGFVTLDSGRLYITESCSDLYSILVENKIMMDEIEFLSRNGKRLTDRKVKELTGGLL